MKNRNDRMALTPGIGESVLIALILLAAAANMMRAEEKDAPAAMAVNPPVARSFPDTGSIGVGAILGEPTGLSLKGWLNDQTAIDGGVAWSFDKDDSLQLHADYLYHKFDLFPVARGRLPLYFGVGGRVLFDDRKDDRFGIRAPVGVAYLFDNVPVEIFAEVVSILDLAPSTKFDLNGGVGVRFYFK